MAKKYFEPTREYYYPHFKQRLKERYNLDITYNQYEDLCKQNPIIVYELSFHNRYAIVTFNNVKLHVIRYNPNILKTVVIDDNTKRPIPRKLLLQGMSKEEFNERLNNCLSVINNLKDHFLSLKKDTKVFFMTRNTNYPFLYYTLAFQMALNKLVNFKRLVLYIESEYCKEKKNEFTDKIS
jgi:hypothetical protein